MSDAESADYPVENISEHAGMREADRLYDHLDDNVSFYATLQEAITILEGMRDPSTSKLFEKIDRISREDAHKWKRSACGQALAGMNNHHPGREKEP